MVFPVVRYGCERWTVKTAEWWRIDAVELWCWRRLLRVPWTARRSNQSILKEISPKYSLEGLMLKLKLQYFGHLMQRTDSLGKTLMLGKIEGRRRKGWQRMRWLDELASPTWWMWVWTSSGSWWWTGKPSVLWSTGSQRVRHYWATELNWTDTKREGGVTCCHRLPGAHQTPDSMWQCFDLVAVHVGPVTMFPYTSKRTNVISCSTAFYLCMNDLQLFIFMWMKC